MGFWSRRGKESVCLEETRQTFVRLDLRFQQYNGGRPLGVVPSDRRRVYCVVKPGYVCSNSCEDIPCREQRSRAKVVSCVRRVRGEACCCQYDSQTRV